MTNRRIASSLRMATWPNCGCAGSPMAPFRQETDRRRQKQLLFNKENNITPISIKKNIEDILENTAEQDHVTVELENAKELVGKDLNKHIKHLEKTMNNFASKLEFEDAARIRDEINRLKAKEVGLPDKIFKFNRK